MYEITLMNEKTHEEKIIFGYDVKNAFERNKELNPTDWNILRVDYID